MSPRAGMNPLQTTEVTKRVVWAVRWGCCYESLGVSPILG